MSDWLNHTSSFSSSGTLSNSWIWQSSGLVSEDNGSAAPKETELLEDEDLSDDRVEEDKESSTLLLMISVLSEQCNEAVSF